jgi:hypothetical protein
MGVLGGGCRRIPVLEKVVLLNVLKVGYAPNKGDHYSKYRDFETVGDVIDNLFMKRFALRNCGPKTFQVLTDYMVMRNLTMTHFNKKTAFVALGMATAKVACSTSTVRTRPVRSRRARPTGSPG